MMDLLTAFSPTHLNFHFLLTQTDEGQVVASVAELADCQVTAASRDEAIAQLQELLRDRMAEVEVVPFELVIAGSIGRENPWEEFIGLYEGDADFAEIATELRAERGLDELGSAS
jgi:hypothetical protein